MRSKLVGATYAQEDPARDPAQFAASLVFLCRAAGVRFMTRHTVVALKEQDGRIDHVELLDGAGRSSTLRGQAYVLALGAASVPHAEDLGIDMPLRFVREYILTMPILDPAMAPRLALRDRQGKLRIVRIETPAGDQLRVHAIVMAGLDEASTPTSPLPLGARSALERRGSRSSHTARSRPRCTGSTARRSRGSSDPPGSRFPGGRWP